MPAVLLLATLGAPVPLLASCCSVFVQCVVRVLVCPAVWDFASTQEQGQVADEGQEGHAQPGSPLRAAAVVCGTWNSARGT